MTFATALETASQEAVEGVILVTDKLTPLPPAPQKVLSLSTNTQSPIKSDSSLQYRDSWPGSAPTYVPLSSPVPVAPDILTPASSLPGSLLEESHPALEDHPVLPKHDDQSVIAKENGSDSSSPRLPMAPSKPIQLRISLSRMNKRSWLMAAFLVLVLLGSSLYGMTLFSPSHSAASSLSTASGRNNQTNITD
jgi:hypothetical protein